MSRARTHHRRRAGEQHVALARMLRGGRSHAAIVAALADFPTELHARKPRAAAHTPWQLLEHLRIAQRDVLDFGRDPEHPALRWPEDYWPPSATPPDARAWGRSVRSFAKDLGALVSIAEDPGRDLGARLPGTSTTWLGQLCLAASHNSYHLGQLSLLRHMQEAKRPGRR